MKYIAISIPGGEPLLIVEADSVEQATSRIKGALHSLQLDASQKFECRQFSTDVDIQAVPVFYEDFFQLLGFR